MKRFGVAICAALAALSLCSAGAVLAEEKPSRASMLVGQKGSSDEAKAAADAKASQAQSGGNQQAGKNDKPARKCKKAKGRNEDC